MLLATVLFVIYYVFLSFWFSSSDLREIENLPVSTYPEQVFKIIDELESNHDNEETEKENIPKIDIESMSFNERKKIASTLKEAGLFLGKITGKGVTKASLTEKIKDILAHNPEAYNFIS